MFLTRMAMDTNRIATQQAMTTPTLLRAAIDDAFDGEDVHPLWRIDQIMHRTYLMLLSPLRPTMASVHEAFGILGAFPSWETSYIGDELESLRAGTTWHFHLCANPHDTDAQPAEALHLLTPTNTADHKTWLIAMSARCGFSIDPAHFDVLRSEWLTFPKSPADPDLLMYEQVTYDGLLTITNPDLLNTTLVRGIGPTQYGTGLMTLEKPGAFQYV